MIYDANMHELWKQNGMVAKGKSEYVPSVLGSRFFENCFIVDNRMNASVPVYILPDLCPHILIHEFNLTGKNNIKINVIGPRTRGFYIDRQNRKRTFIIRVRPVALYALFNVPVDNFTDVSIHLGELLKEKINELNDVISLIDTNAHPHSIFYAVEKLLLPDKREYRPAVFLNKFKELIKKEEEGLNVNIAAKNLGVSTRYLRRICKQHIGLSPKQIIRIERFTTTLKKRVYYPDYTWSDVAHLSGYTDQSHMIAEFQQLMGRTPVQLFS